MPSPHLAAHPAAASREQLIDRFFELRPVLHRRFDTELGRELRDELQSVTVHQLTALSRLKQGALTMRELAKELGVSESAATAITERLVRQDLVERSDDPTDRRVVRVSLSASGLRLVDRIHDTVREKTAELVAMLSDRQLAQLIDILETLAKPRELGGTEADEHVVRQRRAAR